MLYSDGAKRYSSGKLSYTNATERYRNGALHSYDQLEAYGNRGLLYANGGEHIATLRCHIAIVVHHKPTAPYHMAIQGVHTATGIGDMLILGWSTTMPSCSMQAACCHVAIPRNHIIYRLAPNIWRKGRLLVILPIYVCVEVVA